MSDTPTDAMKILWNTGLNPHRYNTIEKAADGAAEIIRSLRGHLDNPPPDVQEKVLAMRGTCTWTIDDDGGFETECGSRWELFTGTPSSNKMRWCPMCGKQLEEEIPAQIDPQADFAIGLDPTARWRNCHES